MRARNPKTWCDRTTAKAVWDDAAESAAVIWGEATGVPIADRLLAAVTAAGVEGLDGTDQRAVFSGHVRGDDLDAVRDYLSRHGLAVTVTEQTAGRPRVRTFAAEHTPEAITR